MCNLSQKCRTIVACLLGLVQMAAAGERVTTTPDYHAYCRKVADRMLEEIYREPEDWAARGKMHCVAHAALVQVRLAQWTGDSRYIEGAVDFIRAVADTGAKIREADFFTVYPFVKTVVELDRLGKLPPDVKRDARAFVEKCYNARDVADHNQALTRACGMELAAQTYPDAPKAESWHRYACQVWELIIHQGDITENSPNYNRIDVVFLFILGDLLERTEDLKDPHVRAMFTRFRDQVTPSGVIPSYGDSGGGTSPLDPDRPFREAWADWVPGFERAAAFYGDDTFRWAAQQIYTRGVKNDPLGDYYGDIQPLDQLMLCVEWTDSRMTPSMPHVRSLLQKRLSAGAWPQPPAFRMATEPKPVLDKLILSPGRHSDAPFVLCDLFAQGPHAHVNQHGGVNWFEVNNVPLTGSLGYNNRGPEHVNLLMMRQADEPFPHRVPHFEANRWYTANLPTSRLETVDNKPHLRRLSSATLRVSSQKGITFWVDNLRLAGSDDERILEDFESAEGWSDRPETTREARQGDKALVWHLPGGTHIINNQALNKRVASRTFDCSRYPSILIDWKLSDNNEIARPFIFRCGLDYHAHAVQLQPALQDAKVEQRGMDQYGMMAFTQWFTADTKHTRRLVLTQEGILVAVDRLWPGASADKYVAGPIWHLGPEQDPQRGDNWFNAIGASTELLVVFSQAPGRTFGVQTVDVWKKKNQRTVFAREQLKAGRETLFVSVLIPHEPANNAAHLAEQVRVSTESSTVTASITRRGQTIDICIANDGIWNVSRD